MRADRGRGASRGSKSGRGTKKTRGRGRSNKSRGGSRKKRKKTRLCRPTSFEKLLELLADVPNMTDQGENGNKLLKWYIEYFFDPLHLHYFQDFADANPTNAVVKFKLFKKLLKTLKQASEDPIQILRDRPKKPISKELHEQLCLHIICDLDFKRLNEAYDVISSGLKAKVMKVFWKKRIEDWTAWKIDQNELPKDLRKPRVASFKNHVMDLIQRKRIAKLREGISVVPEKFGEVDWPWGYSALMYAARMGSVEIATLFLEIQTSEEKDHRGCSFNQFLEKHCTAFIPVYEEWLENHTRNVDSKCTCTCVII